jgi:hypothetical protein
MSPTGGMASRASGSRSSDANAHFRARAARQPYKYRGWRVGVRQFRQPLAAFFGGLAAGWRRVVGIGLRARHETSLECGILNDASMIS